MDIDILGIVLAKRVFQLHGADRGGSAKYGARVMRTELLAVELHGILITFGVIPSGWTKGGAFRNRARIRCNSTATALVDHDLFISNHHFSLKQEFSYCIPH